VEKLTGVCDDDRAATMIAAQLTSDTSYEEAGGRQFLHHFTGHYQYIQLRECIAWNDRILVELN